MSLDSSRAPCWPCWLAQHCILMYTVCHRNDTCCQLPCSSLLLPCFSLPFLQFTGELWCFHVVLERFFTLRTLQAHCDLSLVTHSLRHHSLDLSHDQILLCEQKPQEAGDEEAVANGSGPANPIHLSFNRETRNDVALS